MNLLITPKYQILDELTNIDSFLNITMSEDATEAVQRGNDLAVYVARSGKLLADSKYWLNEAMKSEVMQTLVETAKNAKATATAINALVNSLCREERYLVDWCERCNRTATHQLSWCVTVISKAKEEMKMSGMYNNKNLKRITIGLAVIGLFTALSFSQREDATTREITTAAVMGVVSAFSIITLSTKEDYGTSKK